MQQYCMAQLSINLNTIITFGRKFCELGVKSLHQNTNVHLLTFFLCIRRVLVLIGLNLSHRRKPRVDFVYFLSVEDEIS